MLKKCIRNYFIHLLKLKKYLYIFITYMYMSYGLDVNEIGYR